MYLLGPSKEKELNSQQQQKAAAANAAAAAAALSGRHPLINAGLLSSAFNLFNTQMRKAAIVAQQNQVAAEKQEDEEEISESESSEALVNSSHRTHPNFYHPNLFHPSMSQPQPPPPPPPPHLAAIQLPSLKSKFFESPITQAQIQYDCSAPIARNTPENNQVRVIDYRANKIASFCVDGKELICLPQAFEVFLKNLVGGLHTVYTKLKRLDIIPVVCNVEQVSLLLDSYQTLSLNY